MLNVLVVSLFALLLVTMTHAMLSYELLWTFDVDIEESSTSFYGCPPTIADINNDGELEIIGGEGVGAFENGRVYVLDNSGNELWSYSCGRYVNVNVADIDNDGKIEVIVCSGYGDNHLYVFDGFGNVLWSSPIDSRWTPSTGDIDNDGLLEIIVGFISGQHGGVRAFDADGNIIWTYSTVDQVQSSPAIVDIDGDGFPDSIFGCNDRNLYVFDKDGAVFRGYRTGGAVGSPIVEDLDNDGNLEIIVGNSDDNIYCISNEGAEIWTYYIGEMVEKVAVGDINTDGKLEVLAGGDKLYALVESTTLDALEEMPTEPEPTEPEPTEPEPTEPEPTEPEPTELDEESYHMEQLAVILGAVATVIAVAALATGLSVYLKVRKH